MGIVPGFSLHDELRILVENGFTPFEAIAAGTVRAAEVIRSMSGRGDFGTIETGKRADLLLVNGNPLEDVSNIRELRGVMAAGVWYDREALQSILTPGIPVTGALQHVHEPDGDRKTYVDVVIGKDFEGRLPDAIDTITVTGPEGKLPIQKEDFTYLPRIRDFWISLDGSPEIGTYTFEVEGRGKKGSGSDFQSVVRTFPVPDVGTFSPEPGARLQSPTPAFSWGPLKADEPVYYRLEVNQGRGGRVYATGQNREMLSHQIPQGILQPGQSYRWRVRVTDSDDWVTTQNRSHSPWLALTVTETSE
jgi:hypothetical protein